MDPDSAMREGLSGQESIAQQTSIRYLRLHNGFRNMLKSGLERIDEQVGGAAPQTCSARTVLSCFVSAGAHDDVDADV